MLTPHEHSYATEMLRLGVSLTALMQLLGDKEIRMTFRYMQVNTTRPTTPVPPRPPERRSTPPRPDAASP